MGDVRNLDAVRDVMYGANYVFHAAASKEVPSCEFFPMEAVKTNIIGTDNVITAAVENKVERVVFLSTDKAAYPINSMGMTKAVAEKVVAARAQKAFERGGTVLSCTRYGNVMCSRGSVIPLFIDQIKRKAPISVIHAYCEFFGTLYTSAMKTKMLFYSTVIGALTNIVLNLLMIPSLGALGAAIATMTSYLVVWLVRMIHSSKIMKLEYHYFDDVLCFALVLIQVVIASVTVEYEILISAAIFLMIIAVRRKNIGQLVNVLRRAS